MSHTGSKPQFGAPDPELKTSPIFDDSDRDSLSPDTELEEGVCYFNDQIYKLGEYICSGDELLRCEESGVWIREGSCYKK